MLMLVVSMLKKKLCQISVKHMSEMKKAISVCTCVRACVTLKNVGIVKEEEQETVMSKVRKTERREYKNFGSIVQESFLFSTYCV